MNAPVRVLNTPTLDRKLDLGVFGEVDARIEYDAGRDRDACGDASWFHIAAIWVIGQDGKPFDLWPAFDKETQEIYQRELKHELDYLALHPEEEVL